MNKNYRQKEKEIRNADKTERDSPPESDGIKLFDDAYVK